MLVRGDEHVRVARQRFHSLGERPLHLVHAAVAPLDEQEEVRVRGHVRNESVQLASCRLATDSGGVGMKLIMLAAVETTDAQIRTYGSSKRTLAARLTQLRGLLTVRRLRECHIVIAESGG